MVIKNSQLRNKKLSRGTGRRRNEEKQNNKTHQHSCTNTQIKTNSNKGATSEQPAEKPSKTLIYEGTQSNHII